MTTPFKPFDPNEPITVGGRTKPLSRWRQIALAAKEALSGNPEDRDAQEALAVSTGAIRSFANARRGQPTLSPQDIREAQPGQASAFGMGAANAMSLGLGDEGAGLIAANLALLPGGESPQQAYFRARDENRAFDQAASAFNPATYFAGNIAGSAVGPALAGGARLLTGAVMAPNILTSTVARGAVPGATFATRAAAAGAGGAIGAGLGAVGAYGVGEEGPIADLSNAPTGAALGFLLGAGGTGFVNRAARTERVRVAKEAQAAMAPQATAARIAADRELAGTRAAQRQIAETRAAEFEVMRPLREQQMRDRATLTSQRVEDAPISRQAARERAEATNLRLGEQTTTSDVRVQETIDRAAITAMRRAQMEGAAQGATDPDAFVRSRLAKQGFTPELIERTLASRRQGALPPGSSTTPQGAAASRTVEVREAQMPGQALHDIQGNPIPGTVTPTNVPLPPPPRTPAQDAAARAYTVAETASPGSGIPAARRAAATVQGAQSAPVDMGMLGPFTRERQHQVIQQALRMTPAQRAEMWRSIQAAHQSGGIGDDWFQFLQRSVLSGP